MFALTYQHKIYEISEQRRSFYIGSKEEELYGYQILSGTYKGNPLPNIEVVKTTNDITELFEEYIAETSSRIKFVINDYKMAKDYFLGTFGLERSITIYGAIWITDSNGGPAIKSLAQMIRNEQGEIEWRLL